MSFLNDVKYSVLKVSKLIVDKTGDYSRIARLTLNIKKYEGDIEKKQIEIGKLVLDKMEKGDSTIDLKDAILVDIRKEIKSFESKIKANREEIEELKKPQEEQKTE